MKDEMPLNVADGDTVAVKNLTLHIRLCCKDRGLCAICLLIDTEISISLDEVMDNEDYSDDEDDNEETPQGMN